jgi:hypothetical protein
MNTNHLERLTKALAILKAAHDQIDAVGSELKQVYNDQPGLGAGRLRPTPPDLNSVISMRRAWNSTALSRRCATTSIRSARRPTSPR